MQPNPSSDAPEAARPPPDAAEAAARQQLAAWAARQGAASAVPAAEDEATLQSVAAALAGALAWVRNAELRFQGPAEDLHPTAVVAPRGSWVQLSGGTTWTIAKYTTPDPRGLVWYLPPRYRAVLTVIEATPENGLGQDTAFSHALRLRPVLRVDRWVRESRLGLLSAADLARLRTHVEQGLRPAPPRSRA